MKADFFRIRGIFRIAFKSSSFKFFIYMKYFLSAHMTCFTCRRCSRTSAHSGFTQFRRKFFSHCKHCLDHFIQRNQLWDSGESHFSSDDGICHTGSISVLTWIFNQTANRVTDQPKHIHKNCGGCISTLPWGAAHQLYSSGSCHAEATPTSA